jgi:superfamily II DNA or RNA helicase
VRVQNNYSEMIGELCSDHDRNLMIVEEIGRLVDEGRHVLVVSRRKTQLRAIQGLLDGPTQMLLGGEKPGAKREVQRVIEEATRGTVLLSTVAEEGVDIPRLDVVFLVYPFRNTEIVKQPVGRVMRPWPGKTSALVVDVRDPRVDLLASQSRDRLMFYRSAGYEVEVVARR